MSQSLGIIGLGRVGLRAAKAYLQHGYEVFATDPDFQKADEFTSSGGVACKSPEAVAAQAKIILIFVLNDEQVNEVMNGAAGIFKGAQPGSAIVCMSTINRSAMQTLAAQCRERKIGIVDCPFTGGPARIASKNLTLIAAADINVLNDVRSVLEVIGKIVYAGSEPGTAQAIKHCNQLLVGATHAATMEVITLARRLGLDPSLVSSVISSGIAGSEYFQLLSQSVLTKSPSPGGLGQMCKDMAIVRNTLEYAGIKAHVAIAASEYFAMASEMGMQEREGADLIEVLEKLTNGNED